MLKFLQTIKNDVTAAQERDPAARNALMVAIAYPGLHALWSHRLAHGMWKRHFYLAARLLSQMTRFFTGIEIHPGAIIGQKLFIDHGMGVVIGETAEIGDNVTLYHGVTLGGVSLEKGKRHPTLEDNVVVGAGAKVLGNIIVGRGSRIGANAVVVKPVPPDSVVIGIPGQVVVRSKPSLSGPDLNHGVLPDTMGLTMASMMARIEALENSLHQPAFKTNGGNHKPVGGNSQGMQGQDDAKVLEAPRFVHAPDDGLWRGEDFSI